MDSADDQENETTQTQRNSIISSSSQTSEERPLPNKIKYLTAAVLFYGSATLGCALNTYGPAITSLQNKYETDDNTISKALIILAGCYMVGALAAGVIYNYVNRQLAIIVIVTTMAAMVFITPFCPTLATFFVSAGILGFASGAYDTGQFVWMLEMMQKDCPPYLQTQNFCYALGTNLATFIVAPFLDQKKDDGGGGITTTLSTFSIEKYELDSGNSSSIQTVTKKAETGGTKLFIPYLIVGILVSINAIAQILLFIFMRYYPPPPEKEATDQLESDDENRPVVAQETSNEVTSGFTIGTWSLAKFRMIALAAAFYGAYTGFEFCNFQFFPKFGQNSDLKLSESESAYVLTGMTASYAVGRAIAIIIVFKISTQLILWTNIVLVTVANVILVGWATSNLTLFWASGIIFGLGFSSMYASFSAFIERYINFTNFIASLMIVCGSGVAAIYPLVVGSFIENNPIVLGYVSFFSIAVIVLSFGTLLFITRKNKTRY